MLGTNNSSRLARRRRVPQGAVREVTNREAIQSPTPISRSARRAEAESQKPRNHFDRHPFDLQVRQPELLAKPGQMIQTQRNRQVKRSSHLSASNTGFSWRNLFSKAAPPLPSLKSLPRPEPLSRSQPGLRPVDRSGKTSDLQKMQISRRRAIAPSSQHLDRQPDFITGKAASRKIKSLSPQSAAPIPRPQAQRRPRRPASPLLHIIRLLILGVGIGTIAGTLLSIFNPVLQSGEVSQVAQSVGQRNSTGSNSGSAIAMSAAPAVLQLGDRMTGLTTTIQTLTTQYSGLTPGVFMVDVDTNAYLDLNGGSIFSAASMIKVPILVALLQEVDAGKIRLDESLTMKPIDIASGSGELQYQAPGSQYTVLETALEMITISDNTATNMLIARLGGADALNQRFRQWGLTTTTIRHLLPDLEGTNITTPKELVELMARINQGDLLSMRSRDRVFEIMRHTVTNTLLPAGIDSQASIAHKTGDIGSMVGDVGLVDALNGKRYVITVMVQRPHNDNRAQELIRQISRAAYETISQPTTTVAEMPAQNRDGQTDPSLDTATSTSVDAPEVMGAPAGTP